MKRPLLMVALLYAGGELLANFVLVPLKVVILATLVLAALACGWPRRRGLLLGPLIVLAGITNLAYRTAVLSPFDLRTLIGEQPKDVALRGTLVETPDPRVYLRDEEESWRTIAQVDARAIRMKDGGWQPAFGRVAVGTPGVLLSAFYAGQTVEISGVLQPPKGPLVEGLFDYRAYLRRLGIYYQLQTLSTNDWRLLSAAGTPPLADRFLTWAKGALAQKLPEEDEPLRLLWAMTLGWKTALSGEVSEPFMRSGTMHVFAISGLHIALIAGILVSVLRVLRVPRGVCGLVVIPLIWFYTGVTGWQASAIRSTIMMSVVIAGWSLRRPSDLLNSLAASAFIILLWDPQQLFQASFQLSFFVVLSLALFTPILDRVTNRLWQPDPLLPDELRPGWQQRLIAVTRGGLGAVVTSLAAWLGSIPLVAYYFHLFTPVSLLANLVVVPLSTVALAANLAGLLTGAWIPALAGLFNHSAWFFMWLMMGVSKWAAALPGGCFYVRSPSILGFVLYYGALISVMAGWLVKPRLRVWVGAALALLAVAWLSCWQAERVLTRLTFLPLNGGDAIYVDASAKQTDLLIDCGNESSYRFVVRPFLRAQGLNRVPSLLLTHGDVRHVGGAELVHQDFSPKQVLLSPIRFRSLTYRQIEIEFRQSTGLVRSIQDGEPFGSWRVLHPSEEDRFTQADDSALVLWGDFEGTRILLLSDLGQPGQNRLLQRRPLLRADIVVTGLPAQGEPIADALLEAIQPRVVIVTDSEYPATARASAPLRERLQRRGVPVLFTRETGAVTLTLKKSGWRITPMMGRPIESGW